MCVAIFWALRAWMPSRWAFLGAIITALKLCVSSYWINSYWGGAAATLGGALVLGGLGRLRKGAKARDAILLTPKSEPNSNFPLLVCSNGVAYETRVSSRC